MENITRRLRGIGPVTVAISMKDDQAKNQLEEILRPYAITIFSFGAGNAKRTMHREKPNVLIFEDNSLTGCGSGQDTSVWLALAALYPDIPVFVTSRHADDRYWATALNLGAFNVLAQPFDAEELLRSIESAVLRSTAPPIMAIN